MRRVDKRRDNMKSEETSFEIYKAALGIILSPVAVLIILPIAYWWSFWGAKISSELHRAFGWPLLSITQIACVYITIAFFRAKLNEDEVKSKSTAIVFTVATPFVLWLTVLVILWLGA
jgi:hypothetical protein